MVSISTLHIVNELNSIEKTVVKTLLYFEIFNYPLTANEIHENCQYESYSLNEVLAALAILVQKGLLYKNDKFYSISNKQENIDRRIRGNVKAQEYFPIAQKYTRLISGFPFVEGVFLSGSIAKGFVDEKGDIDYFIITKPGRLWMCRTLLVAFKKIFLFNSHKYFCVNYFVDSKNLAIPDKNIFTATEIAFAKPAYNSEMCQRFFGMNEWSIEFYPNKSSIDFDLALKKNTRCRKRTIEKILSGKVGEILDTFCFRLTLFFWKKKFKHFNSNEFDLNLRSRKNVSKHHPNGFQFKVLDCYTKSIERFEIDNQISLK